MTSNLNHLKIISHDLYLKVFIGNLYLFQNIEFII